MQAFGPQLSGIPNQIMTNILILQPVTTYNVTLPDTPITCEPLLMSIFELNNNNSALMNLMKQVYQAQEAYYNATGNYAAFSEGTSIDNGYMYEWIVAPDGRDMGNNKRRPILFNGMTPIIFNKAAFGFLALYNSTYALNMVISS